MDEKSKCRELKEIRTRFAQEHQIPYETRECTYEGDCPGTCPLCEQEKRYLFLQAERRAEKPYWEQSVCTAEARFPLLKIVRLRVREDGPGVRSLVTCPDCPLRCTYCINRKVMREGHPTSLTVQELMDQLMEDGVYFSSSGGGITFGGGEPLLYMDFIRAFAEHKPKEWNLWIETSLAVPELRDFPEAGYLVDCKSMDPEIYRAYTGGELETMRRNLEQLLREVGAKQIIVRIPKIPEYNDHADQERSAEVLRKMGIRHFDFFDYQIRDEA